MSTAETTSRYTRPIGQRLNLSPKLEKLVQGSIPAAREVVAHYKNLTSLPFDKQAKAGHLRGIDFYDPGDLVKVIAFLIGRHKGFYEEHLDLIQPTSYTEKINWSKLFREIKIPESGNKLLTGEFIPSSIRDCLSRPSVVWHSPLPVLPSNDAIAPGEYYLKSNHGSDRTRRIRYPLTVIEKQTLEQMAAGWLRTRYGMQSGEWFYNAFQREVMLEQAVTSTVESISWDVYVFGGEIEMISANQKTTEGGRRSTWFDRNFNLFRAQARDRERAVGAELSNENKDDIVNFALEMAKQTDNVRFDFFVGDEGRVFLGEVTFTTLSGRRGADRDFDFSFGQKWLINDG
jgi:hypothetical protein